MGLSPDIQQKITDTLTDNKRGAITGPSLRDLFLGVGAEVPSAAELLAPGGAIGLALAAKANAADLGTASALQVTQLSRSNLWFNPDCSLGNGSEQLLPNTALNIYGPDRWTCQQTGLNPFETVSRVVMPEGDTAIFWMNGVNATGANTFSVGTKTLNTTLSGLNFVDGFDVEMVDRDDITKKMFCTVVSYAGTTLVLNATSVSDGATGSRSNWVVGRNGHTVRGKTTVVTTAPTAVGSDIITVADSSLIEKGATIEYPYDANFQPTAGTQLGAYVVSRPSPTTIRMSKVAVQRPGAAAGVAILAGQSITTYGNQGHYGYQDVAIADIKSFRFGTAAARPSAFDFDVVSNVGGLKASVMFLGYKPAAPFIGRALTQSFPITTTRSRVRLNIPGDTQSPDSTWIGDGLDGSWGTLGFALDSAGSPTSQNIPDGVWVTAPPAGQGIGGSDQQTFQLGDMVGAWVKITAVKWGLDRSSDFEAPTSLDMQYPTPFVHLVEGGRKFPRAIWENTSAGVDKKIWEARVPADGSWRLTKFSDTRSTQFDAIGTRPDGTFMLYAYIGASGVLSVASDGSVSSSPNTFTNYTPGVSAGSGTSTFGPATAGYVRDGDRMFVHISVPVTAVGSGTGALVADLPLRNGGRAYTLVGFDSQGAGKMLIGKIFPNATTVQIFNADLTTALASNVTLNVDGWYQPA
jgi:hypothetical protein